MDSLADANESLRVKSSKGVSVHEPVLLNEIVESFSTVVNAAGGKTLWYLDGTLGGAGHALAIAGTFNTITNRLGANKSGVKSTLNIIGLDEDPNATERAKKTLASATLGQLILENENFCNLDKVLDKHGVKEVDMILLDIGVSSDELETSGRGFTFMKDEPLLMTLGDPVKYPFTARDIVNNWKEEDIANVIFAYGEERFARRIARHIIEYREMKMIETSGELAEIVKRAVPFVAQIITKPGKSYGARRKIHPATKTFQALRIAVNDELNALKDGLREGFARLAPGGRMAVITFHSLEDRIVKEYFKELAENGSDKAFQAIILTKKPITPTDQELAENPRSRSAKLRIIQKT